MDIVCFELHLFDRKQEYRKVGRMYKPKEYPVPGKDYFAWEYEPQTMMKHAVLGEYYRVWATKLGKYQTAHFFDCFGGCG